MSLSRLKKVAREYNRHPKGSPGGVGGQFAPKDKVSSPVKGDGVNRLKTIATKAAKQPIKQPGQPAIEKDLAKIKAFKKIGEGYEANVYADIENGVVYKVFRDINRSNRLRLSDLGISITAPSDTAHRNRAERQAALIKRLNKIGIGPKLYNYDPNTGVIAMEWVNSDSKSMSKDPIKTKKGKLKAMVSIIEQVKMMHNTGEPGVDKGLMHKDLHSGNIMADSKGNVTIIDFGHTTMHLGGIGSYKNRIIELKNLIADFTDEECYYKGLSDTQSNELYSLQREISDLSKTKHWTESEDVMKNMQSDLYDRILEILKNK